MLSISILSTQSPRMIKVVCRTAGSVLMVNRITFVVLLTIIPLKLACLTMESLKRFGRLITVNLE